MRFNYDAPGKNIILTASYHLPPPPKKKKKKKEKQQQQQQKQQESIKQCLCYLNFLNIIPLNNIYLPVRQAKDRISQPNQNMH